MGGAEGNVGSDLEAAMAGFHRDQRVCALKLLVAQLERFNPNIYRDE